jgi:hypothetical protein
MDTSYKTPQWSEMCCSGNEEWLKKAKSPLPDLTVRGTNRCSFDPHSRIAHRTIAVALLLEENIKTPSKNASASLRKARMTALPNLMAGRRRNAAHHSWVTRKDPTKDSAPEWRRPHFELCWRSRKMSEDAFKGGNTNRNVRRYSRHLKGRRGVTNLLT